MRQDDFRDACRLLGVSEDAGREAVEEAFRERRLLYATESLATYALFEDEERADLNERLEAAYEKVIEVLGQRPEPEEAEQGPEDRRQPTEERGRTPVEREDDEPRPEKVLSAGEGARAGHVQDGEDPRGDSAPPSEGREPSSPRRPDTESCASSTISPSTVTQARRPADEASPVGAEETGREPEADAEAKPPAFEPGESPGAYLRRCRESLGLSIADLATETRIGSRYLEALEEDGFCDLQAEVYVRGFVTTYAKALRASPVDDVVGAFVEVYRAR